jgi:hypothetical protein
MLLGLLSHYLDNDGERWRNERSIGLICRCVDLVICFLVHLGSNQSSMRANDLIALVEEVVIALDQTL